MKKSEKLRLPLDFEPTEQISKRIVRLLSCGLLSQDELGFVLKNERSLRKVDVLLARSLYDRPLPKTDLRPLFWDAYNCLGSKLNCHNRTEVQAGWVHGLSEGIALLELKYLPDTRSSVEAIGDDDDF